MVQDEQTCVAMDAEDSRMPVLMRVRVDEAPCGVNGGGCAGRREQRDLEAAMGESRCQPRRVFAGLGAMALVAYAACNLDLAASRAAKAPRPNRSRAVVAGGGVQFNAVESAGDCEIWDDTDMPGNDLSSIPYVLSAELCCDRCQQNELCLAWTWNKPSVGVGGQVCSLKGAAPRVLTRVPSAHHVSGISKSKDKEGAPMTVKVQPTGQSLYCIALVQPDGYETGLISMQYTERAGIFLCDEYGTYSNRRLQLAPGVFTGIVNSTLKCPMGGEFGTALNTGIFLAFWAKVVMDGRFMYHDWTVKADPDTVFFPSRLRSHLTDLKEAEEGVYLNNCQFGLHGPIEVFSRNAVRNWALGAGDCVAYFTDLCSGPCGWGEDMFIDQCLLRKLKAQRVNDYTLLMEAHCAPPAGWDDCTNASVVAFHPFKKEEDWKTCVVNAAASRELADPTDANALISRK